MAVVGNFASIPKIAATTISSANSARDGTGTLVNFFTSGVSGSRVENIVVSAQGSTTAGSVRIFIRDGTTSRYLTEVTVPANTVSATNPPFTAVLSSTLGHAFLPMVMQAGYSLQASTVNAELFNVHTTFSGDF